MLMEKLLVVGSLVVSKKNIDVSVVDIPGFGYNKVHPKEKLYPVDNRFSFYDKVEDIVRDLSVAFDHIKVNIHTRTLIFMVIQQVDIFLLIICIGYKPKPNPLNLHESYYAHRLLASMIHHL